MADDLERLYRILDANLNRGREGLRVCEDICRFVWDKPLWTRRYKECRHDLTDVVRSLKIERLLEARDITGDVGRGSMATEFERRDIWDIFYANAQRVKESLRVLEEVLKMIDATQARKVKGLRYRVYAIETEIVGKRAAVCDPGHTGESL